MKDIVFSLMLIFVIVCGYVWYVKFIYDDCIKVGHSTLYCILKLGAN